MKSHSPAETWTTPAHRGHNAYGDSSSCEPPAQGYSHAASVVVHCRTWSARGPRRRPRWHAGHSAQRPRAAAGANDLVLLAGLLALSLGCAIDLEPAGARVPAAAARGISGGAGRADAVGPAVHPR